jgi:hypothetical protein
VASVLAWIVGAVAAVGVGVLALSQIGDGLTSRNVQPLTPEVVAREASAAAAPSAVPSESESPGAAGSPSASAGPSPATSTAAPSAKAPPPAAADKLVTSPGGTAVARCSGGQAYLVSWSPEQGYRADDVARGPSATVSVKFESGNNKVFLTVRCAGGEPQASFIQQADDHGGRGGKTGG